MRRRDTVAKRLRQYISEAGSSITTFASRVGEELYGRPLSRATVNRWLRSQQPIPGEVVDLVTRGEDVSIERRLEQIEKHLVELTSRK